MVALAIGRYKVRVTRCIDSGDSLRRAASGQPQVDCTRCLMMMRRTHEQRVVEEDKQIVVQHTGSATAGYRKYSQRRTPQRSEALVYRRGRNMLHRNRYVLHRRVTDLHRHCMKRTVDGSTQSDLQHSPSMLMKRHKDC